ncbi:MAG: hypothetical protein ABGY41_01405, partial [Candidatus Poribacteria bacterium]
MTKQKLGPSTLAGIALSLCVLSSAWGTIEYHTIESRHTPDAGFPGPHELTVYTPPGYEESRDFYPILWVHHGGASTIENKNRALFGDYAQMFERIDPIQNIADDLLREGKIVPMIMVGPAIPGTVSSAPDDPWGYYFFQEIVPFIQANYRVARGRAHWAAGVYQRAAMTAPCWCSSAQTCSAWWASAPVLRNSTRSQQSPTTTRRHIHWNSGSGMGDLTSQYRSLHPNCSSNSSL